MIVSLIVTSYFVIGLKINTEELSFEPFYFSLPFPSFRDNANEQYWNEVLEKVYTDFNIPKGTKLYLSTQEETLLNLSLFEKSSRISDILANNSLPVVYVGETRGSVKGVISPFIISPTDFYRWFYLAQSINQVENYFYNRRAYGVRTPVSSWERGFEESLFREKLTFLFENNDKEFFDKTHDIVLSGEGVINAGEEERLVLSFLDSAIPGFWRVYLDRESVSLNLENVKLFEPKVYKKISSKFFLKDLAGCLVVPEAKKLELKYSTGDKLEVDLQEDSISLIPFEKNNKLQLKVFFAKQENFIEVTGGEMGLVVDNRPRPLLKDKTSKQRINSIERWLKEISSKVEFGEDNKITKKPKDPDIIAKAKVDPVKQGVSKIMDIQVSHKMLVEKSTKDDKNDDAEEDIKVDKKTVSKPSVKKEAIKKPLGKSLDLDRPVKAPTKENKNEQVDLREKDTDLKSKDRITKSEGVINTKKTLDLDEYNKKLEDIVKDELAEDKSEDSKPPQSDENQEPITVNRDRKLL